MKDLPDLLPDTRPSFELFKVSLEKVRVVEVSLEEVRVVKVALEEVSVIGKVPLGEVSVVGLGMLFLAEEAAVLLRVYRQHEVKRGEEGFTRSVSAYHAP